MEERIKKDKDLLLIFWKVSFIFFAISMLFLCVVKKLYFFGEEKVRKTME